MMEEVSISVAYDAHIINQMSEEEILASLVAESFPKQVVPSKKMKLKESEQPLDPLDRYQRENRRLQEVSLRLEQENDDLAHKLVSSKVELRSALDQAEDRVDELTKELLKTQQQLQATEEARKGNEEEVAQLKLLFRKQLDKAEAEVSRSNGVVADYKQICSQLNGRLEKQQAENALALTHIKNRVMECENCRSMFGAEGSVRPDPGPSRSPAQDEEVSSIRVQVRALEKELAQTKLLMVESRCRIQDLEHQNGALTSNLQAAKNSWFSKTLGTLKPTHHSSSSSGQRLPPNEAAWSPLYVPQPPQTGWLSSRRLSWALQQGRTAKI